MKDYYKILEIPSDADIVTIKKAYRRLAFKYHPDKNKAPNAAQKFIEITEAYEVLRDVAQKEAYDRLYNNFKGKFSESETFNNGLTKYYSNQQKEWSDHGTRKAKEYSSMPFSEFARKLLQELNLGANYIPNAIAVFLVGGMFLSMLTQLPEAFEYDSIIGLLLVIVLAGLLYVTIQLFKVAKADYTEERKRKFS